jgi:hypothetical protein
VRAVVLLISALLWALAPSRATGETILDFEDVGRDDCVYLLPQTVFTQGFILTNPLPGNSLFTCNGASDPRQFATNGTRALLTQNLVLSHVTGAPFDLLSFDLAEEISPFELSIPHVWVVGTRQSGEVVARDFTADGLADGSGGIADFEAFSLGEEFSDLASLQIMDLTEEVFFLDNISILVPPEYDDPDGDGVSSWEDNCPDVANPDQRDADGNGIGDACNDDHDADGDEWADDLDNCALSANPDQLDADLDGWGDACDNCPSVDNPSQQDDDPSNGVGDACEDSDGDGLTNLDELTLHGCDPWSVDTDRDGLGDGEEVGVHGSNPSRADTDGDGIDDGEEVGLFETSPTDFDPVWVLGGSLDTRMGDQSKKIAVTGKLLMSAARTYVMQIDGEPSQERGVWFEHQGKLMLYQQNLLEVVGILERELAAREGEPIEIAVSSIRTEVRWNKRSGGLSLRADARCNASFRESGFSEPLSRALRATAVLNAAGRAGVALEEGAPSSSAIDLLAPDGVLEDSALGEAPASVPVSVWKLFGSAVARLGHASESGPISAILTLNGDRTYTLGTTEDDPHPDTGVWFQERNRIFLYEQDLLEQVVSLEERLAQEFQEPVEVVVEQIGNTASIKDRTGVLSLRSGLRLDLCFPRRGVVLPYSFSMKVEGTSGLERP